jgi:hypothetical protein
MQSSLIYHQRKYLELGLPLTELKPWPEHIFMVDVAQSNVANVRAKPNTTSTILRGLPRGSIVIVSLFQGLFGKWSEIGDDQWVSSGLLRLVPKPKP